MTDVILMNQLNLVLQFVVAAFLFMAIVVKIKGRPRLHGLLMVMAYVQNLGLTLFIMVPLLLAGLPVVSSYSNMESVVFIVHYLLGVATLILASFLVARFALARFTILNCRGKWLMRMTAFLWSVTLGLGLFLYSSGFFPG
ncbi:MAG: hypothetical protein A4E32_00320 [Methanomassiliicoccales archaeon PtaU1.Bin124]|nr:MAG: hypothetical protein A4E32_00320 [Methanomassiliicoccales archaeon PtaU1.Bin124]